jgi:glutathione S-transferase
MELRTALAGRDYLCGGFTYADVAMAVVLQMVRPVADAFIPLGPAVPLRLDERASSAAEFPIWWHGATVCYAVHRR